MRTPFSKKDEISSTEKLLDVIRGDAASSAGLSDVSSPPVLSTGQRARQFLANLPFIKNHINVGVEIGYGSLALVKIAQLSESRFRLLDYRFIPFKPHVLPQSPGFPDFLRSAVISFCGSIRNVNLWTSISTSQVDMRQIRIPKVSKKEVFNAIFWTAKREMVFDEKEIVFDFEVQGEVVEDGITKTRIMTYTAPKGAVKELKGLFSRSGLRLAGLTTTTFAVQNLFRTRWVPTSDKSVYANLYLSDAYSRIAVFSEGNLVLTREIKAGVDSLIISLVESFGEAGGGPSTEAVEQTQGVESLDALEKKLDTLELNWERAKAMLCGLGDGEACTWQEGAAVQPSQEELVELVRPALERLLRQVERTFEYSSKLGDGESVEKIFISGALNICPNIISYFGQSMGVETEIMDPLNPSNLFSRSVAPPVLLSDRIPYTGPLGLALSDNSRTPNLLFTFKDKEEQAAVSRINRSIFWVFLSVVLVLMTIFLWQEYSNRQKKAELSRLTNELAQYTPAADQSSIMQLAARVKNQQSILKEKASEYVGIAVLSELSALTPPNIRLISITADLGLTQPEPQTKGTGTPGQSKSVARSLVIDGIVRGDSQTFEASLARFLMRLGSSPIFINPTIHSTVLETYQEVGEVFHFVLKMGLV
jgi:Tfp pilus assembly PilM family ATPase